MTIVQLEYFLAVVRHGSFSVAAKHCFVTQPSLSTQIGHLEQELGMTLLERSSKPIVTTEAGRVVSEQAKKAVAAFYGTKEKLNGLKDNISGNLRLGIIPTVAPYLAPWFIREFHKRCPEMKLEICEMFTSDLVEGLNRETIDIAILSGGIDGKPKETVLFNDKLYAYVAPANKLYGRDSVLIKEIEAEELLLLSRKNCLREQVLEIFEAHQKTKWPYKFTDCSLETLMHTVDASSALTIIPGMAIEYIPEEKRKQVKPLRGINAHRKITMAVRRNYVKESLVSAVRESVMAAVERFEVINMLLS
jgi:LysR family hydrogen peroxide-inducible transcriptional activator